jgi:glyoxylase-like metal-dependent hydrolase (beta-lactamase superfamily II)/predicted ester cyclase
VPARSTVSAATEVGERYFAAVAARDIDAMLACWAPDGVEIISGERISLPDGFRDYFGQVFGAFPDLTLTVLDTIVRRDRFVCRYRLTGTFAGPVNFQGMAPNGARISFEGCDVLQIRDGTICRNDAFVDGMQMARGLGVLPPEDSVQQERLTKFFNLRTRLATWAMVSRPQAVADGVWVVRGGFPVKSFNVYLLRDGEGVALFDAGIHAMTRGLAAIGARMGGITRVILGHGHHDHRGAAPGLGAPVLCHPAEVPVVEGDGGWATFDFSKLNPLGRFLMPRLLRSWDGGPVEVAGTLSEDDDVLGFRVLHIPGHSPGQIALFRESDRLALTTDCFYTLDPQTTRKGPPRLPHAAFTPDPETARASIRKVAALAPREAWPGHAEPVTGDVRSQLEAAAA